MVTDLKHKKNIMEILADAFSIGASMADIEPHLRDQCYYHSDLINKGFYSAEKILQHMDWVCEEQKEFCRCEIVLLQDILRHEIKLAAFDRYEGVAPCEYALLFYEGDNSGPAAVIITMMDDPEGKWKQVAPAASKTMIDLLLLKKEKFDEHDLDAATVKEMKRVIKKIVKGTPALDREFRKEFQKNRAMLNSYNRLLK